MEEKEEIVTEEKTDLSDVEVISNGKQVDLADKKEEEEVVDTDKDSEVAEKEGEEKKSEAEAKLQENYNKAKTSMEEAKATLASKNIDYNKLQDEYDKTGTLSEESYKALEKAGYNKQLVDAIISGWQAQTDSFYDGVIESAGGQEEYNKITTFVSNQSQAAVDAFNNIVANADLNTIKAYLQGVKAQMIAKYGTNNPTLTGGGAAKKVQGFSDQNEMIQAMSDKRYGRDAKYTKEVEKKLAVSSIFE